ncbi:DnaJ domain-containing protein [Amaricoccus tamworthensis]|uniref:DnaJ domain-containing protein n=1 Tax=Amaricoccus tamworthensis TaxID=57002 RepID=UPI003C79B936
MRKSSPFDFDISVSADKKRRARARGRSGAIETSSHKCAHPDCEEAGKFRAPRSPDHLDEFLWFCKKHIREYNLKWNFFETSSDADLEKQFASDRVWERSTKPFAESVNQHKTHQHTEGRAWQRFGLDDPMELLGEMGTMNPGNDPSRGRPRRRLPATERRALDILEANDAQTKPEIRKLYKALVKDLHPDMNGGRRDDEARLNEVVWAWDQIKSSRNFRD